MPTANIAARLGSKKDGSEKLAPRFSVEKVR